MPPADNPINSIEMERMMSDIGSLVSLIDLAKADGINRFRATMLVQVATLRVLIKAAIVTVDDEIYEIDAVQAEFSKVFGAPAISEGTAWAKDLLRGEIPLHGSVVERSIQQRERLRNARGDKA